MWDEQAQLLSRKFKVLRYDTRGHGQSSAPPGPYTLDQLADDVHALLAALGIKQTQPEVFNKAMLGFLDKHAGRGSAA